MSKCLGTLFNTVGILHKEQCQISWQSSDTLTSFAFCPILIPVSSNQKASPQESKESSNSSPPPPLQFITLTERPASHKNDYSYTVRSHAMQAFLHEKKNAKGDKAKQKRGPSKNLDQQTPKQLSGKFKLASWTRKPRTRKSKARSTNEDTVEHIIVKDEDIPNEVSDRRCKYSVT